MTSPADRALDKLRSLSTAPRVLVVGDVMLDRFVWGEVKRISPEAPVPVVKVREDTSRLGGAANVAANLTSLQARVRIVGCVGSDSAAAELRAILAGSGVTDDLVEDDARITTVKTRILARAQQVVRVDREDDPVMAEGTRVRIVDAALAALADSDAVVVSDYDKGVVHPRLLEPLLAAARERDVPVVVDPKLPHFTRFEPITVISPNEAETGRAAAMEIRTDEDCVRAAENILGRLDTRAVLVTRGERGMLLLERDREPAFIPAVAREVYDVTGAGDTVAAVLVLALSAGATLTEAAWMANHAAGIVVGKVGTARVGLAELAAALG